MVQVLVSLVYICDTRLKLYGNNNRKLCIYSSTGTSQTMKILAAKVSFQLHELFCLYLKN